MLPLFSVTIVKRWCERFQSTTDRVGLEFDGRIVGQTWSKIRRNHLENLKTDNTMIETLKFDRLSNSIPVREYTFEPKNLNPHVFNPLIGYGKGNIG